MANTAPGFEKALESEFEKHFDLPTIRRVPADRPFTWLAQGFRDMRGNLVESLAYGVILSAIGWAIWTYTAGRPQQFTASITGFFLLAPLLAAGLYEISRRHELGKDTGFGESLQGWRRSGGALAQFGLELVIVAIFWERLSAILFALFYNGAVPNLGSFYRDLFLSGDYWRLLAVYAAVGGVLAIVVFVLSAISIPMLLDRNVDIYTDGDQPGRSRAQHPRHGGLGAPDRGADRSRLRHAVARNDRDISSAGSRDLACVSRFGSERLSFHVPARFLVTGSLELRS
jgi:uncharacterized membrane protein